MKLVLETIDVGLVIQMVRGGGTTLCRHPFVLIVLVASMRESETGLGRCGTLCGDVLNAVFRSDTLATVHPRETWMGFIIKLWERSVTRRIVQRGRTSFLLVLSGCLEGSFWDSCKFAPTLVELDEREWERSWVGWGCLCRGAMGRRELCVQVLSGPAQPQQATKPSSWTSWRGYSSSRSRCAQCCGDERTSRVSQMLAELKDLVDKKLFSQVSSNTCTKGTPTQFFV